MNYSKHYSLLMEKAKTRKIDGYTEKHHIIPRCLNGTDESENIVEVTPEEHYIAHLLLVKMYPGNNSLLWAAYCMTGSTATMKRNNKIHGWLRRKFSVMSSEMNKGKVFSEETRAKLSAAKKGKKQSKEHIEKRIAPLRGRAGAIPSEATRKKMALAKIGNKNRSLQKETQ